MKGKTIEKVKLGKFFVSREKMFAKLSWHHCQRVVIHCPFRVKSSPKFKCQEMVLEKSRSGFYTITFINRNNLERTEILNLFMSVGEVRKIIEVRQRVFVRFKDKEEANRAIRKFGNSLLVEMAKNNEKFSGIHHSETAPSRNQSRNSPPPLNSKPKMDTLGSGFHLILGNVPKNYTMEDVKGLVEEAKPLHISEFEETRAFHIKFCHIVLDSFDMLTYLMNKLDGFIICGEKLVAMEGKRLLELNV